MENEKQVMEQEDVQAEVHEDYEQAEVQNEVAEEEKQIIVHEDKRFKMTMEVGSSSLYVFMEGRLDTSTADGMLGKYKEEAEKRLFSEVTIDMEKLEYLSSAGLRVLLLMRKNLAEDGSFHVVNMNSVIQEIMDNTGFAEILV